jgi:hypothetical protein
MIHHRSLVALVVVSTLSPGSATPGQEHRTYALFNLDSRAESPFPSDWHTVRDHRQNTGRRVNLTTALDCQEYISDCEDLDVINALDGFNLQPRLSIPFSGAIDASTVSSGTVRLVSLGSTVPGQDSMPWGTNVGIDQIVWDTFTNTLQVESDALLAQHTRFALIVTRGIRDANGLPVRASDEFRRFLTIPRISYTLALVEAMWAAWRAGVSPGDIVVASVFTTQSATAILEKIRDQIRDATPDPADFLLGSNGERTTFSLSEVTGITLRQQTRVSPPAFASTSLPLPLLGNTVNSIAFGKYRSPDYEVHPGEYIPAVGTRTGTPAIQGTNEVYFNLFLPSGSEPANGWPVVIFGHGGAGGNQNKDTTTLNVVSSMANYGIATIAINAVGFGFGPLSTLTVSRTTGTEVTLLAGGRGMDQDGNGTIDGNEGLAALPPRSIVTFSDGFRQTAVDLMQLVRLIEVGVDVDGNGLPDLDASRISYFGSSLGAGYGAVFLGVEPDVRMGVLAAPFDPVPTVRLAPVFRGTVVGASLAARQPSLLNPPGIKVLAGVTATEPYFHENLPLRQQSPLTVQLEDGITEVIQSPVTNTVPGALAIQEAFDNREWVSQAGSPAAYAPHLRAAPLRGLAAKSVLLQIAKGDQSAGNPSTTAIIRAGDLADHTLYYRHDLYRSSLPNPAALTANPHGFATSVGNPLFRPISLAVQDQAGRFFFSDGGDVAVPQPSQFFEFPIVLPLPENLNFIVP